MNEIRYIPPYTISDNIVNLISNITELLTKLTINSNMSNNPKLRRENRIKTIQASLAIENNTLTLSQVTDIINGKRILGAPNEIHEVKNAFDAYDKLFLMNPYSKKDILLAHKILMNELTKEAGVFRKGGVGVFADDKVVHIAPPAERVPELITDLMEWAKSSDVHPLIKSSVFHYEFEFIHPFSDGNGRMGRMWQTLILYKWNNLLGWLPIETLIKERQEEYYRVLNACDQYADSGLFIEFILTAINDALNEITMTEQVSVQVTEQVGILLNNMGDGEYTSKELMHLVGLKHRPTFQNNYLLPALKFGYIEMTIPDKPRSGNQKYRKV